MTPKFTPMSDALQAYAIAHSTIHPTLDEVARETDAMGDISVMQMAPEQGALTTLLVRALGATNALEIGSFTGYGTISIAAGLPEQGRLIACELDEGYAEIIRRNVDRAGRRRPGRGAGRARARHPAGDHRGRPLRLRLHRRRQADLPRSTTRRRSGSCARAGS